MSAWPGKTVSIIIFQNFSLHLTMSNRIWKSEDADKQGDWLNLISTQVELAGSYIRFPDVFLARTNEAARLKDQVCFIQSSNFYSENVL
jgi:hypothetical protein